MVSEYKSSTRSYAAHVNIKDAVQNEVDTESVDIHKMHIKIFAKLSSTAGTSTTLVAIRTPKEHLAGTDEEVYNAMNSGTLLDSKSFAITSSATALVWESDIENPARVIEYGVAFNGLSPEPLTDNNELAYIENIEVSLEYKDPNEPPVIIRGESDARDVHAITEPTDLTWTYSQSADVPQKYVDVSLSVLTEDAYVEIISKQECTTPSITIKPELYPQIKSFSNNMTIMWFKVRAYSENDVASEWSESWFWNYVFPTAWSLSPGGGESKPGSDIVYLEWESGYRAVGIEDLDVPDPTEYDIEYSADAGESWRAIETQFTAPSENGVFYCAVPQGAFPTGIINWRVRAYANGYTVNLWSQESFIIRVQASTSSVNCDGKPHPTVSWSASSQIAYQVRFADYDSGAVYGTATSHRIPYFYADGAYPVQVRTQADDGKWSAWTEPEYVTIRNTSPAGSLILTVQKTRHAVALEWSGTVFGRYILYRNGIPVYIGSETRYTDPGAHGECTYYVRGIADPNYLKSNSVSVDGSPATDCMYDLATQKWIPLRYSAAPRSRAYSETANAVYKYYAGRKYPVAYLDGTADRQLNVAYCFKTMADADAVREALGHPVIYKDTRGRRIIGIFGSMTETVERRLVLHTLNIVQVDYNEEVRYET